MAVDVPVELSGTVTEVADANLGNRVDATQPQFTVRRISNNAVPAHCTASLRPTVPGSGVGRCPARLGIIGV